MVKDYLKNPIFLSVVLCILIFYSGLFKIDVEQRFYSFYDSSKINFVYGELDNSPVKNSSKKYYRALLNVKKIGFENNISSSSYGKMNVMIPSNLVEAFFPGKLYSISRTKNNYLFESGGNYSFKGYFRNNVCYVTACTD